MVDQKDFLFKMLSFLKLFFKNKNVKAIYLTGSNCLKLNNNKSDLDIIVMLAAEKKSSIDEKNAILKKLWEDVDWNFFRELNFDIKTWFICDKPLYFLTSKMKLLYGDSIKEVETYNLFDKDTLNYNLNYINRLIISSLRNVKKNNYIKHSYLLYLLVNMYINKSTEITEEMYSTAKQIRETKSISKELFEDLLKKYEYIKETYNYLLA